MAEESLRAIPGVDRVLHAPQVERLLSVYSRSAILFVVRDVLDDARIAMKSGSPAPTLHEVATAVEAQVRSWEPHPRQVINATGVILHTNLGRAPLSEAAMDAVVAAAGYCDLEYDLGSGRRGSRQRSIGRLLRPLLGAEAAHVAVNNAAAVTLALAALARGRDVIVSRGQAVEIGGGFRVPVILRQSGARLVEVGTTNRTRVRDYEDAVTDRTAAILHVHSSNFRIIGFTESPDISELARLAQRRGLILIDDNGSGALLDTAEFGLGHEPLPAESLRAGADLVAFSGDKLLGGPQSGILVGREEVIKLVARHPLARPMRPDKLALAALSATLLAYLLGRALEEIPVWQMISQPPALLAERAARWKAAAYARGLEVELVPGQSTVGGGSLPGESLPTTLLFLPARVTAGRLSRGKPAVVARTRDRRVLLDLRTVPPHLEGQLLDVAVQAAEPIDGPKNGVLDSGEE